MVAADQEDLNPEDMSLSLLSSNALPHPSSMTKDDSPSKSTLSGRPSRQTPSPPIIERLTIQDDDDDDDEALDDIESRKMRSSLERHSRSSSAGVATMETGALGVESSRRDEKDSALKLDELEDWLGEEESGEVFAATASAAATADSFALHNEVNRGKKKLSNNHKIKNDDNKDSDNKNNDNNKNNDDDDDNNNIVKSSVVPFHINDNTSSI